MRRIIINEVKQLQEYSLNNGFILILLAISSRASAATVSFPETPWSFLNQCRILLLLRAVVSGKNEKNIEKLYERASSTRPKLKKRAPNIGGFAANIACGFLEFWTCGTRSLIKFLEVFFFIFSH